MFTIKECCDRYQIASTKTLYTRINGLKDKGIDAKLIVYKGKSFIPEELQKELDSLDSHINRGGKIAEYQPLLSVSVLPPQQHTTTQQLDSLSKTNYFLLTPELIEQLAIAVANNLKPADPFWHIDRLKMLARFEIEITSAELKSLIKVQPQGDRFNRGSFEFIKVGKIGRQSAWRVRSILDLKKSQ